MALGFSLSLCRTWLQFSNNQPTVFVGIPTPSHHIAWMPASLTQPLPRAIVSDHHWWHRSQLSLHSYARDYSGPSYQWREGRSVLLASVQYAKQPQILIYHQLSWIIPGTICVSPGPPESRHHDKNLLGVMPVKENKEVVKGIGAGS